MKKFMGAFALAGMIGLTACGPSDDDALIIEEPVLESVTPAPVMTEPAPPTITEVPIAPADSVTIDTAAPAAPTAP